MFDVFVVKCGVSVTKPFTSGNEIAHGSKLTTYIHTYIRLLTTSPKGLFSANYKEKDKNKNIYKLFKVTIANH